MPDSDAVRHVSYGRAQLPHPAALAPVDVAESLS